MTNSFHGANGYAMTIKDQDFHALVICAPKPESRKLLNDFIVMMTATVIKGRNLRIDLNYDEAVGLAAAIEDFLR